MSEWKECVLGDVIKLKRGYDLPHNVRLPGKIPVVSSSGITDYHAVAKVKGPGVVTGRYGTLGEVFFIKSDFWPLNTSLFVEDFKGNDPCFISYWLRTLNLGTQNAAGAVPGINRNHLHAMIVHIPAISIQHRIADILSAYDDLIENCQRRIKILEDMARNLYREWFVRFQFPGHEKVKMVSSPLGEIPEGWEVRSLSEVCSRIEAGGTPKRTVPVYWEKGEIDWYKTGELLDGFLFESQEKITDLGQKESNARLFEPGTILMAIYGSPTVGRMGILTKRSSCNQAALGLVANQEIISQGYLFFVLFYLRDYFNGLAQGAAQQNISKEKVANAIILVPSVSLINTYNDIAKVFFCQIERMQRTIQDLRRTRDLLLPRLMSGELDIEEK